MSLVSETFSGEDGENSTEAAPDRTPKYISKLGVDISFYYILFVFCFGSFGNLTNIVVIKLIKLPVTTKIILTILAISDVFYLVLAFPETIIQRLNSKSFYSLSNITCKIGVFSVFFEFLSSCMVALLATERSLAVTKPLHSKLYFNPRNIWRIITIIMVLDIAWYCFIGIVFEKFDIFDENGKHVVSGCSTTKPIFFTVYQNLDLIVFTSVPLLIVLIANATISVCTVLRRRNMSAIVASGHNRNADSKLLLTTFAVSLCFVVLSVPLTIYVSFCHHLVQDDFHDLTNPYFLSFNCMNYTNYGINFYLYLAFTRSFRDFVKNQMKTLRIRCRINSENGPFGPDAHVSTVSTTVSRSSSAGVA